MAVEASKLDVRGNVFTVPFNYEDTFRGAVQANAAAPGQSGRVLRGARKERCWMILLSTNARFVKLVACKTLVPAERAAAEADGTVEIFTIDEDGGWEAHTTAVQCADPLRYPRHLFQRDALYKGRITRDRMLDVDKAVAVGLRLGEH
jgi:hypothetical protein